VAEQDDTGDGWGLGELDRRVLTLLNWAWEAAGGAAGARASLDPAARGVVGDADILFGVMAQTLDWGLWKHFEETLGDSGRGFVVLTAYARDLIERIRAKRTDPRWRRPVCRHALVH
jgi:hypothetical protein